MRRCLWRTGVADSYTRHNQAVVVPDERNEAEDAAEFFGNNKLRYNVIDSVFSKDGSGSIVELVPGVGSKVKEGRIVFVTINADLPDGRGYRRWKTYLPSGVCLAAGPWLLVGRDRVCAGRL